MISNIGADTLRGRGTRVWEVIELDNDGKEKEGRTFALKDVWIDHGRAREGDILEEIRATANGGERVIVDTYFLTTLTHGDVFVGGDADKTRRWAMPAISNVLEVKTTPKEFGHIASNLAPVGAISVDPNSKVQAAHYFSTKSHYRIVFNEVGKTIREVDSLCTVFECLRQVVVGKGFL